MLEALRCVWMGSDRPVDIRRLKTWARKNLPGNSKLRDVILLDEDRLLPEAFLAKMDVWLALYDVEHGQEEKETRKR